MPLDLTNVAVVFDPNYGMQLHALAERMAVWIADSPGNRVAIEAEWTRRRRDGAERELNVFRTIEGMTPGEMLGALLRTIDRQLGPLATDTPFETLHVVGARLDAATEAALLAMNGTEVAPTDDGFRVSFDRTTES